MKRKPEWKYSDRTIIRERRGRILCRIVSLCNMNFCRVFTIIIMRPFFVGDPGAAMLIMPHTFSWRPLLILIWWYWSCRGMVFRTLFAKCGGKGVLCGRRDAFSAVWHAIHRATVKRMICGRRTAKIHTLWCVYTACCIQLSTPFPTTYSKRHLCFPSLLVWIACCRKHWYLAPC